MLFRSDVYAYANCRDHLPQSITVPVPIFILNVVLSVLRLCIFRAVFSNFTINNLINDHHRQYYVISIIGIDSNDEHISNNNNSNNTKKKNYR